MRQASRVLVSMLFILGYVVPACHEFCCCATARADEKRNEAARITGIEPAVMISGAKTSLKVRGFKLKEATELRLLTPTDSKIEITEKKDAGQPKGLENKVVGDTQFVAEVTLPSNHPTGVLQFVIATPAGEVPGGIMVLSAEAVQEETEPNNGFREAHKLQMGQSAGGSIQGDKDVDVYAYPITNGKQYKVTVTAGGPLILDADLNCYNSRGQLLAASDDAQSRDPVVILTSPVDDIVFLCVSSAHDIGGEWHSYLLTVEELK